MLVVDEASMLGTRALAELVARVDAADGKLVVVGDTHQLPAIEAGGALGALATRLTAIELLDNRRQEQRWEREAVELLLSTRFGLIWGIALLAWLWVGLVSLLAASRLPALRPASVGATGLALPAATTQPALAALAVPVLALALLPALAGHAGAEHPVWLNLPANILHILAVGAWLGGIVVLVAVLRSATARLDGADRTRLLAASVSRFSTLAGVAIAVILASGIVQALISINAFSELLHTAYGRAVLIKLGLFLGIVALGWVNRSRHLPALRRAAAGGETPGAAGAALRAELAIGVAVLAATGALAGYAPAKAISSGPFSTDKVLGPARLEATVDPARVGANQVHLYLFNRRDGSQFTAAKELTVEASLPAKRIAPIDLHTSRAGPGHYVITGASFGVAGNWRVEVAARVSEFDEYRTTLKVPIR